MLGYKTHADFVLEQNMAKTPENVYKLLNDVWKYALPQAKKEAAELQAMIDAEGGNFKLESWDWWYYTEKLRQQKYALNEEEIKPYFKMENVREGFSRWPIASTVSISKNGECTGLSSRSGSL